MLPKCPPIHPGGAIKRIAIRERASEWITATRTLRQLIATVPLYAKNSFGWTRCTPIPSW